MLIPELTESFIIFLWYFLSAVKINSRSSPNVKSSRDDLSSLGILSRLIIAPWLLGIRIFSKSAINPSETSMHDEANCEMELEISNLSSGKINLLTKYQLNKVNGSDNLESIDIKHDDGEDKNLKTDYVLGFFGLIMQLGPIANWGLNIDKKTIEVDTEKFETNQKGIYAVGDICTYPGKLKLILSGFHEGALAARACFKLARPNEKYRFEFTTSSKTIKERLGVKGDWSLFC